MLLIRRIFIKINIKLDRKKIEEIRSTLICVPGI